MIRASSVDRGRNPEDRHPAEGSSTRASSIDRGWERHRTGRENGMRTAEARGVRRSRHRTEKADGRVTEVDGTKEARYRVVRRRTGREEVGRAGRGGDRQESRHKTGQRADVAVPPPRLIKSRMTDDNVRQRRKPARRPVRRRSPLRRHSRRGNSRRHRSSTDQTGVDWNDQIGDGSG